MSIEPAINATLPIRAAASLLAASSLLLASAAGPPRAGAEGAGAGAAVPATAPVEQAQPRLLDNGDGTLTDRTTGLIWEKKCRGCGGLHEVGSRYYWSGDGQVETVWDWLDRVNAEGGDGLGGHGDWRIPHVKELVGLIDHARYEPAARRGLHSEACVDGCRDLTSPRCSCVERGLYWTSTTFADFTAHAIVVDFDYGFVDDRIKTNRYHVRAVRGGAR